MFCMHIYLYEDLPKKDLSKDRNSTGSTVPWCLSILTCLDTFKVCHNKINVAFIVINVDNNLGKESLVNKISFSGKL